MLTKVRGKVFASLESGTLEIHIAYGYGLNDGLGLERIKQKDVPYDARMPNSFVWITIKDDKIIKIEKMNIQEAKENDII